MEVQPQCTFVQQVDSSNGSQRPRPSIIPRKFPSTQIQPHPEAALGLGVRRKTMRSLEDAVKAREPLVDIVLQFKEGIDYQAATDRLNSLGSDLWFHASDWYGDPRLRTGQATAEGIFRHFKTKLHRQNLDKWNQEKNEYEGIWEDAFCWSQDEITGRPKGFEDIVESIGSTQPGANDDGQYYEPEFEIG